MYKYYYTINQHILDEDPFWIISEWSKVHGSWVATEAAEHEYRDSGGEQYFPCVIHLWDEDKQYLGAYEVEIQRTVSFMAYKIDEDEEDEE